MALFAQRLDPVIEMIKADSAIKGLPSTPLMNFDGVDVRLVALPTWFAFTKGNGSSATIFVSSVVVQSLSEAEFEALLWHEAGHAIELEVTGLLHLAVGHGHVGDDGLLDVGLPDADHGHTVLRDARGVHQPGVDGKCASRCR